MMDKIKDFVNNVLDIMKKPEMLTLPSTLAYYFVLSAVPIISIVILIATSFNLSASFITDFIADNLSEDLANLITPIFSEQTFSLGFMIYLGVSFFLASNGSDSIIVASNMIFNLENKHFIKRRLKAFGITLIIFLLFTFMLIVPLFGEQIISICISLGIRNSIVDILRMLYPVLNVPVTLIVMYFAIKLIYVIAPDDKIKSKYVSKGAIFTTSLWFIVTMIYSYYIKNIADYSHYYAGFGTIVMLMVWLYILAFIFVIGISLNYRNATEDIERTNTIKLKELEEKVRASKIIDQVTCL